MWWWKKCAKCSSRKNARNAAAFNYTIKNARNAAAEKMREMQQLLIIP
jgi:hypothetical protein